MPTDTCPCGSTQTYAECCGPFLSNKALPETAEKLMRSRYTAFTRADMDYLKKTLAPESQSDYDSASAKEWAEKSIWKGLQINSTEKGTASDKRGIVEFTAVYEMDGKATEHHEVSQFRKNDAGQWLFVDGEFHTHAEGEGHPAHQKIEPIVRSEPKTGRNDPCTCGSGKKYKKCCELKSG